MLRTRHLVSAIATAMLLASAAQAADRPTFTNVVVFGDSLSDNGNLSSLTPGGERMRFTTNPGLVASEVVASHYGFTLEPSTSGGTDYAWGGAQSAKDLGTIVSAKTQVNQYLAANGGRADSHALYTMWIGANDILNLDLSQDLNAQMVNAANAEVSTLKTLQQAGARYIVVYNLPDVSNTPEVHGTGLATIAGQLGSLYNSTLDQGVATLGAGILPVNTYALLNQVIADPTRYGFSNVTDRACTTSSSINCTTATLAAPDAASTYLFADGVHPTTAAHAMLAEVVLSELQAPQQISLLGEAPLSASAAYDRTLGNQMRTDSLGAGTHAFVNIDYAHQRFDASSNSPAVSSDNANLTLGFDMQANDHLSAGVALGASRNTAHMSGGGGYHLVDYSALGYITYHAGGGYVGGYGHYGQSDFNHIERNFQVGAARVSEIGDTDGSHRGIGINGGWWFDFSSIKTGPFVNLDWQDIKVDGYRENGNDATAMWFGNQHRRALIGTLGWRLQGQWQVANLVMAPYAELAWNRDSKADDTRTVSTGLNTMNGSFAMEGFMPDKAWGTVDLGLTAQLTPTVTSWIGYSNRFSDTSQRYNNYNMGFRIKF
jgi:outer membrane lipase/esterase